MRKRSTTPMPIRTMLTMNGSCQLPVWSNHKIAKWDRAARDHEDMIKALEARDGKRLAAIVKQQLLDKRDTIMGMADTSADAHIAVPI